MQIKEQKFKELFLTESGRMYKAAYILLGDEDEAKDVVQDVFAKLWAGTIPLKEGSQRTYLLTCVRNRCLNIIAHRQTQQETIRLLMPEAITTSVVQGYLQFAGHQSVSSQQAYCAGFEETTFNF